MLNPRLMVLGGLFGRIHPSRRSHWGGARPAGLPAPRALVRVVPAALGVDAPLLGAAELAFEPLLADPAASCGAPTALPSWRAPEMRHSIACAMRRPGAATSERDTQGQKVVARAGGGPRCPRESTEEETTTWLFESRSRHRRDGDRPRRLWRARRPRPRRRHRQRGAATAAPATAAPASEAAAACIVGVSWNNYQEERWAKWDEPAIKAAIEAGGGKYISNDAKSSAETQATNVENLISQGAKVVIILAQDGKAIKPAVASAIATGVPVIAYDRLIEDPEALYITFDNVKLVGKMQAEAVLKAKPKGNYVVIKGNKADANADFLRAGWSGGGHPEAGGEAGDIMIVGETYTDNWDPANAQTEMEQFLTANDNKIDVGLRCRTTAWPVASSRRSRPRASPARCRSPARTATWPPSTVSRSARRPWTSGRTPASSARPPARLPSRCARNPDIKTGRRRRAVSQTPGGNDMTSILLTPIPITKDNLDVVLDAGWITKDDALPGRDGAAPCAACS